MSTDWNIKCIDCNSEHTFDGANHCFGLMRLLIKHAPQIAALAPLFADRIYDVELRTMWGRVQPDWFATHASHRLMPISEYGDIDGTCGERFACLGGCGCSRPCGLPIGHAGDHERAP